MDWKRLFNSLGMNGTHWQWRIMRWQQRWEDWKGNLGSKKQVVTYQHKFCSSCGGIMDRNDTVCPQCQVKAPSWKAQSVARAIGLMTPSAAMATPVLLLVNIGLMVMIMLRYGGEMLFSPSVEVMTGVGALFPGNFFAGEYWRLITYGYLHYGLLHIGFNMMALSQVGPLLEKEIGTSRFFTVYTLALIGGGLINLYPVPAYGVLAGASGALFGLIGFGLSYCHFSGGHLRNNYRGFFFKWGVYGFIFGFALPGISNLAHFGGFVVGLVLGFAIEKEQPYRNRTRWLWWGLSAICIGLTIGAFVWMLMEGGGRPLVLPELPTYFEDTL